MKMLYMIYAPSIVIGRGAERLRSTFNLRNENPQVHLAIVFMPRV